MDERRASPLTFDILVDGFLACISNSAAEIAIAPKCPFLPEVLFAVLTDKDQVVKDEKLGMIL